MDEIKPTPRNELLGLLADSLRGGLSFATNEGKNKPMNLLAELLGLPAIQKTTERLSYGEPLTTGKGLTTRLQPETFDAAMGVAPFAKPITKGALALSEGLRSLKGSEALSALAKSSPMADRGAIVWHGSPHKFDAFDASKIGTGEGAQAYGHGLYLAESPDVAKGYQSALARNTYELNDGGVRTQKEFEQILENKTGWKSHKDGDIKRVIQTWIDNGSDKNPFKGIRGEGMARNVFDELAKTNAKHEVSSNLYKVDLPDEHIARMLDWDKPLSQQAPVVQSAVNNYFALSGKEHYIPKGQTTPVVVGEGISGDTTGKQFYEYLRGNKGEKGAAEALRWGDVPGIKYLDGGSRGAGQGSQNFVVFPGNERLLKILERNGQTQ